MILLIDGRTIKKNPSGVGIWNIRLTEELLKKKVDKIYLLLTKNCDFDFSSNLNLSTAIREKQLELLYISPSYKYVSIQRFFFEQLVLSVLIRRIKPDIYHATDSFGIPFLTSAKTKKILTVHDLIPLTPYREYMNVFDFFLYKVSLYISLSKTNSIIAISDKTKEDLEQKCNKKSIRLIYDGVDQLDPIDQENKERVFSEYQSAHQIQKNNYLLYYGGFGLRRNVPMILYLFADLLKTKQINSQAKLVLSGRIQKAKKQALSNLSNIKKIAVRLDIDKNVVFLDYLTHEQKVTLLHYARLFVSLSFYEGFGLAPLEALNSKTPTITSKVGVFTSYPQSTDYLIESPSSLKEVLSKTKKVLIKDITKDKDFEKILAFIKNFKWSTMTDGYFQLYKELLEKDV